MQLELFVGYTKNKVMTLLQTVIPVIVSNHGGEVSDVALISLSITLILFWLLSLIIRVIRKTITRPKWQELTFHYLFLDDGDKFVDHYYYIMSFIAIGIIFMALVLLVAAEISNYI